MPVLFHPNRPFFLLPGMKSRGVYETPGGTLLLTARRAMESITLDRGEAHLKVCGRPLGLSVWHANCRTGLDTRRASQHGSVQY